MALPLALVRKNRGAASPAQPSEQRREPLAKLAGTGRGVLGLWRATSDRAGCLIPCHYGLERQASCRRIADESYERRQWNTPAEERARGTPNSKS